MKRLMFLGLAVAVIGASSPVLAESPVSVNFGFVPLGIGMVQGQEGFAATRDGKQDSIDHGTVYTPAMFWGMDFKTPMGGFGFDLMGTSLMHGGYQGAVGGLEVAFILPHPDNSRMSQRIKYGYLTGTLDWRGDHTDVEFDDATGWQAGYAMDLGRTGQFHFEILYRNLVFDVIGGDPTNDDKLDLSGVVLNFGVRFDIDMGLGYY